MCVHACVQADVMFGDWFSNDPFAGTPRWLSEKAPGGWGDICGSVFKYNLKDKNLQFDAYSGGGATLLKSRVTSPLMTAPYTIKVDFLNKWGSNNWLTLWAQRQSNSSHYWIMAYTSGGKVDWQSGGGNLPNVADGVYEGFLENDVWYTMVLTVEDTGSTIRLTALIMERDTGKIAVPKCIVSDSSAARYKTNAGYGLECGVYDWLFRSFKYLDNFMVYNGWSVNPPAQPLTKPLLETTVYQVPTAGVAEFHFDTWRKPLTSVSVVFCSLYNSVGNFVWSDIQTVRNNKAKIVHKGFGNLPVGNYTLRSRGYNTTGYLVAASDKTVRKLSTPAWLNNDLGKEDIVPEPWTPVEVSGANTVSVWGREYIFNDMGLPVSLVSSESDLLSAPMRLTAIVNGQPDEFRSVGQLRITPGSASTVIEGDSVSIRQPQLMLHIKATVEFDGFARVDLSLTGSAGITVNQLWLETPIAKENALFYLPSLGKDCSIPANGIKKPITGDVDWDFVNLEYPSFWWVGGDDRGFVMAAEDDRNWKCANRNEAQELVPATDGNIIWRYHFVDPTVTRNMATPLNITYCWQATPVKPVDDWYKLRCTSDAAYGMNVQSAYNLGIRQEHIHELWTEVMGRPWTDNNQAKLFNLLSGFNAREMNLAQYAQNSISDALPEYAQWSAEWSTDIPITPWFSRGPAYGGMLMQNVSQGNHVASWADYYIYHWDRMIREWGANGVYCDGLHMPMLSRNPYHPNAYKLADGTVLPTRTIFETREFMKRFYIMAKGNDPDFFFLGHMCTLWFMPTAGFLDYSMGGESLGNFPAGYETPWSYWRAGNTGRQFGVQREFFCTSTVAEDYAVPLALVHGISVWGRGYGSSVFSVNYPIWNMWRVFGISTTAWVPYWKNSQYVTSSSPDVKVSYYTKPGQILLIAATNKRQKPHATVAIDLIGLGLNPAKLSVYAGTNGPIPYTPPGADGILRLSFPDQTNNGGYVWIRG